MKELIKRYLDRGISRRGFLAGLGAAGVTSLAAKSMASSLAPFLLPAEEGDGNGDSSWLREMHGTGGALLVAQLKAAGIEHIFFNPSSGEAPIFDALVDEPDMHLIKALHEGSLAAMADGYSKASGKASFVLISRPGLPNSMTQMFNSWKDQIPVVVAIDTGSRASLGQDGFEEIEHVGEITSPITKWHWTTETVEKIPEVTRRALKFATTRPCGPVFVAYPEDILHEETKASVMDQSKFDVSMNIRPDPALIERAARMVLEAGNPLLHVGDEVTWCGAQKEVVELAELLALPTTRPPGSSGWSKPFPSRSPLYLGDYQTKLRHPGNVDVMLNLGSRMPYAGARPKVSTDVKLIQVRLDPVNLARVYPTELGIVGDLKMAAGDLLAAVRSLATADRLQKIREARLPKTQKFTSEMREFRRSIAKERWDRNPISLERLAMEVGEAMEKDACFVSEIDSGRNSFENLLYFGGDDMQYFSNTGRALGWALPAAFGIKLARPNSQVVAVMGDGAFLFAGPQALWSYARYRTPVIFIVQNNQSYNNERNRIWYNGGRQFETGRDMACYLGDPTMDFAKMADGCGVEGEVVKDPSAIRAALERAKRATVEGRPYLLDVHVERGGIGGNSTWHPPYSIADLRQRKV